MQGAAAVPRATTSRTSRPTSASTTCACPRCAAPGRAGPRPRHRRVLLLPLLVRRPAAARAAVRRGARVRRARLPVRLCWANENWTRAGTAATTRCSLAQRYSRRRRSRAHPLAGRGVRRPSLHPGRRPAAVPRLPGRAAARPAAHRRALARRGARLGVGELYLVPRREPPDERRAAGRRSASTPRWSSSPTCATSCRRARVLDPSRASRERLRPQRPYRREHMPPLRLLSSEALDRLGRPGQDYVRFPCVTPVVGQLAASRPRARTSSAEPRPSAYERWLTETVRRRRAAGPGRGPLVPQRVERVGRGQPPRARRSVGSRVACGDEARPRRGERDCSTWRMNAER